MEDNFKFEIIRPEKIIYSNDIKTVTIPSYEGDMSILKNHISIIAFLRPGIVKIEKSDGSVEEFFVQDGTIEFFKNILVLLSSSAKNIKDFLKKDLEILKIDAEEKLSKEGVTDEERYVLNHKLDAIKGIRV